MCHKARGTCDIRTEILVPEFASWGQYFVQKLGRGKEELTPRSCVTCRQCSRNRIRDANILVLEVW